jgi:hypothetical protein
MTARWITTALLLVASPLAGQGRVVEVGDRVRVKLENVDQTFEGRYVGVENQYVLLETGADPGPSRLRLSSVRYLAVHTGTKSKAVLGAVLGGVAVGIPLALITGGLASVSDETSDEAGVAGGFIVGAAIGAGIGALIGSSVKSDIWEPVELPAKPMVAVHRRGRFSVGLTIPVWR